MAYIAVVIADEQARLLSAENLPDLCEAVVANKPDAVAFIRGEVLDEVWQKYVKFCVDRSPAREVSKALTELDDASLYLTGVAVEPLRASLVPSMSASGSISPTMSADDEEEDDDHEHEEDNQHDPESEQSGGDG